MRARFWFAAIIIMGLVLSLGCGDDDGGGNPRPVTGVDITPDKSDLEIGHSTGITAAVSGGESKALTWSVNGIENGNDVFGTITQNSSVMYNAPDSLPDNSTIVIGAVSVEDETQMDTCHIHLRFTKLFVNGETGNDTTGTGSVNIPVRTITRGLGLADSGMTVLVAPGVYDDGKGETFPLLVESGISLVGEDWEDCVIRGHVEELTSSLGIALTGNECALRKFTIEDAAASNYDHWWTTIAVTGPYFNSRGAHVDSILCFSPNRYGGAEILLLTQLCTEVTVENCRFVVEDSENRNRGIMVEPWTYATTIRDCIVSGFEEGMTLFGGNDLMVEGCAIEGNRWGIRVLGDESDVDCGGGARGSLGGNTIRDNSECGLTHYGESVLYAKFNTWANDPPVEGVDICNKGTGSIVTE